MVEEKALKHVIGLADSCELLSIALAFPTEALAEAVASGALGADAASCLADIDRDGADVEAALSSLVFREQASDDVFGELRKEYSTIFLAPGARALVFPYESAFLHRLEHCPGSPVLFRSRSAIDVEKQMRDCGVLPQNVRQEPPDSVWNEFSFLSFLYGSIGNALYEGNDESLVQWKEKLEAFWLSHGARWLSAFFSCVEREGADNAYGTFYASLSVFGRAVVGAIAEDVTSCCD